MNSERGVLVISVAERVPGLYNAREPNGEVYFDLTIGQVRHLAEQLGLGVEEEGETDEF